MGEGFEPSHNTVVHVVTIRVVPLYRIDEVTWERKEQTIIHKTNGTQHNKPSSILTEKVGFEPTPVLKTGTISHSDTSPN